MASVPQAEARALKEALGALETEGLRITVDDSGPEPGPASRARAARAAKPGPSRDRPGDLRGHIARRGVNLQELSTECLSASWSGETLFKAVAASSRAALPTAELRRLLEALANELMVDVTLDDLPARGAHQF